MEARPLSPELYIGEQSDQSFDEYIGRTIDVSNFPTLDIIKTIALPPTMPYRRVYAYAECVASGGADYIADASLLFFKGGSQVGRPMPLVISKDLTNFLLAQSKISVFTGTNVPGPNSILVNLKSAFTAATVYLNPCFLKMDADKICLKLNRLQAQNTFVITDYRVFFGVISSASPWSG